MKKIVFGITSLTIGGAERVLVDLANKLSNKYDITIFTIYPNGEFEKSLLPNVKLISIFDKQYKEYNKIFQKIISLNVLINRRKIYEKYIKNRYDVEIAFLEGPITRIFSTVNPKTRKIAWIHNDIGKVFGKTLKSKIKQNIDKNIYDKFDKLVFVSEDNCKKFKEIYENEVEKKVVYNYVNSENVIKKSEEEIYDCDFSDDVTNFVIVGRLVEQKAFERLINIHAKLIKEGKKHNFYIIGDGPQREKLEKLINDNNVNNTFKLIGKRENPYPYMKKADYFCLLSYFEGYPMVVEEAKILNKQILITDTAAREVVKNYDNSQIFENTDKGIYEGLLKNIGNKPKRAEITKYNNEYILQDIIELVGE